MTTDDDCPRCDTCGAPITTGLMAAFCPRFRECEFYTPELESFMGIGWSPQFPNQAMPAPPPAASRTDAHALRLQLRLVIEPPDVWRAMYDAALKGE